MLFVLSLKAKETLLGERGSMARPRDHATFGDPDVITDETVMPLLEKVRLATAQEVEAAKNKEIEHLAFAHAKRAEEIAQLGLERDHAEGRRIAAEERAASLERAEREREKKLVFRSFERARRVYVASVVGISFLLGFLAFAIQRLLVPDVSQSGATGVWAQVQQVGIPAVVAAISGLGLAWDIPELVAGGLRNRISDSALRFFAGRDGVSNLLEEYAWDFKAKTITPLQK